VKDLCVDLDEDQKEELKEICSGRSDTALKSIENTPVFGSNIKVSPPEPWALPDFSKLLDMTVKRRKIQAVDAFTMQYKSVVDSSKVDKPINVLNISNLLRALNKLFLIYFQYGMPWIIEQVECWCGKDFMGGLPSNEVAESLAEILRSYRSNDELQGEV